MHVSLGQRSMLPGSEVNLTICQNRILTYTSVHVDVDETTLDDMSECLGKAVVTTTTRE